MRLTNVTEKKWNIQSKQVRIRNSMINLEEDQNQHSWNFEEKQEPMRISKRQQEEESNCPRESKKPRIPKAKTIETSNTNKSIQQSAFYMPQNLIPQLSEETIISAANHKWGQTISTGWLRITEIGTPEEWENNKFFHIMVKSENIPKMSEIKLRIKVSLPIPNTFPIDAIRVGNFVQSKSCKIYNKNKGYATLSIVKADFVVDTTHNEYEPYSRKK